MLHFLFFMLHFYALLFIFHFSFFILHSLSMRHSFAFIFLLVAMPIFGQPTPVGYLPQVGKWQSFLHLNSTIDAVEAGTSVYLATPLGLIEVAEQYEYYYLNKVTGMSDMGVAALGYNFAQNALVVAYENGNIDIRYKATNEVINLPAIRQNNNIVGSKKIHSIYSLGNKVYFSCDFGVVELDVSTMEFGQTTFTNSNPVFASTRSNEALFIATELGIFKGLLDGRNLQDFTQWQLQGTAQALPTNDYTSQAIYSVDNQIFATLNDTLMRYNESMQNWAHVPVLDQTSGQQLTYCHTNYPLTRISTSHDKSRLYLITDNNVYFELELATNTLIKKFFADAAGIRQVVSDQFGATWVADFAGAYRLDFQGTSRFEINSPNSDRVTSMAVDNQGHLWATSSPINYQDNFFDPTGFFRYNRSDWRNFNINTEAQLNPYRDAITVAANSRRREVFIGSFMDGIVHLRGDSIVAIYNQDNTTDGLQGVVGDPTRCRITGMTFDGDNNCWITNSLASRGIVTRRADGTWRNFESPYTGRLGGIAIDRNGYKWIVQESGNLLVFDEGEMDDDTDNRYVLLTTSNSELASNTVNCVRADNNGTIWVGTNSGVTIFSCGQNVFEGTCLGSRPVVNPDNFLGRLLEGENINAIAVDGANRKWIGTNNGVFLLSDDGYERVHYFNVENSPLLDNNVVALAVDGTTGMVYMSTNRGMVGYRSDATTGVALADTNTAYAFPNPVRPEYVGTIAITGLPANSNVKITDISGQLVHETRALGGQAVWDGVDYTGRRTATGVYLG
jgi:ligand-binding sensor domain-containing protein